MPKRLEKYTKQQDNVGIIENLIFLSKEIEYQTLEIQLCEKRINEFIAAQEAKSNEVAASEEIFTGSPAYFERKEKRT